MAVRILIDAMGGDNAPGAIVRGAVDAVRELGADYSEEEIRLVRVKFLCEVAM